MSRSSSSDIGVRLVGLTLAISVFGAIAQGALEGDGSAHATTVVAATAAGDQLLDAGIDAMNDLNVDAGASAPGLAPRAPR